jgi:hypothetical protein
MNEDKSKRGISRRGFLRGAGMGAGAAGVAAVAAVAVAGGSPVSAETAGGDKRRSVGYRETEHVRQVYELSRF